MRQVYTARLNEDQEEGRGVMIPIASFFERADADRVATGRGVHGIGNGAVTWMTVYESYDEYLADHQETLRQSALKKLSPEEKQALGIEG